MKTFVLTLILTLVFGSFVTAQTQNSQQIAVRVNTEKKFSRSKLKIKFLSVEDSRCPQGTDCVWAGNAKVKIKVTGKKGKTQTFELNTGIDQKTVRFEGYEIKLGEVTPYPATNIRIDPRSYTAQIIVAKV